MRLFFFVFSLNFLLKPVAYSQEILQDVLSTKQVLNKLSDTTSLSLLAAGTVATFAIQPYDDRIRDDWKNHQQMSQSTADAGDFLGTGIAGVLIVGGQYFFDSEKQNWKSHARALIWESAAVFTMKYSFGRQRPGNSSNYHSFPSGHSATAFATATSLSYSYGWKAGLIAYPLATLVGLSRLADDVHWGSDVVAGAFVGVIMARASSPDEILTKVDNRVLVTPIIGPEFGGINYLYSF